MESEIYIHAATAAVYTAFTDISQWSAWYPNVVSASWRQGNAWQDGAQLQLKVRNALGMTTHSVATVRMSVPNSVLIWENEMPGLQVVCTARFNDDVGGCKLAIRKNFHGSLTFLLPLLQGRQQRMLTQGLSNLKQRIEGQPRR